jgi:hypothetical protein
MFSVLGPSPGIGRRPQSSKIEPPRRRHLASLGSRARADQSNMSTLIGRDGRKESFLPSRRSVLARLLRRRHGCRMLLRHNHLRSMAASRNRVPELDHTGRKADRAASLGA